MLSQDWGATHSTGFAINNGLDLEMPEGKFFTEGNIQQALDSGNISHSDINNTCIRILSGYFRIPADKRIPGPCDGVICIKKNVSTPEHKKLARKLSAMSTVLLKNEGDLLPLDKSKDLKVTCMPASILGRQAPHGNCTTRSLASRTTPSPNAGVY